MYLHVSCVFSSVCVCVFITLLCWGCYYLLMVRFKMQHHISRWYNNASLFHPLYLSDTHTHPHTHVFMLLVKIATCSSHRSLVCICIHDATVKCWFPGFLTGFSKMAKTVRNRAKEVKLLHHSSFHWIIGIKDLHYSGRVRECSPQPLHRQTLCPCLLLNHP